MRRGTVAADGGVSTAATATLLETVQAALRDDERLVDYVVRISRVVVVGP